MFWTSILYGRVCVVIPIGAETGYRSTFCCRGDWNARSRYAFCFGIRMCQNQRSGYADQTRKRRGTKARKDGLFVVIRYIGAEVAGPLGFMNRGTLWLNV